MKIARCLFPLLFVAGLAAAQPSDKPNAALLVAKPGLSDPNFRQTVVLATQAPDGNTVGVILNRPGGLKLAELLRGEPGAENYKQPVFTGGPVMRTVLVATFRSQTAPAHPAFHVRGRIWLTMHPELVKSLIAAGGDGYRLYAGFSGWAPGQLASELRGDGWYVMPVREELLFRKDTAGMWNELVGRAQGKHAGLKELY